MQVDELRLAHLKLRHEVVVAVLGGRCGGARLAPVGEAVRAWVEATGAAGAVWTDLEPNFAEVRGEPFSIPRAVAYLQGLTGESREEAVRYIDCAPASTDTPLRRALAGATWWRDAAARHAPPAPIRPRETR